MLEAVEACVNRLVASDGEEVGELLEQAVLKAFGVAERKRQRLAAAVTHLTRLLMSQQVDVHVSKFGPIGWVRLGRPRLGGILLNPVRERTEGAVRISRVQLLRNCLSAAEHGTRGFTCTVNGHLINGLDVDLLVGLRKLGQITQRIGLASLLRVRALGGGGVREW